MRGRRSKGEPQCLLLVLQKHHCAGKMAVFLYLFSSRSTDSLVACLSGITRYMVGNTKSRPSKPWSEAVDFPKVRSISAK
jgi:hypothetical protein